VGPDVSATGAVFPTSVGAALYGALYLLTLLPGLPVGWWVFGRQSPLGWVAGALAGYALSALAFWVPAWLGWPHPPAFLAAWLCLAAATWRLVPRGTTPLVTLPAWARRDTRRWLLLLCLVLIIVWIPFRRAGETDATGARNYHAYFTADFVWHMAMTQELGRFSLPPTNPYLAPETIHYYWAYFLVPAVLSGPESSRVVPIDTALKVTATGTALLIFSVVFLGAWAVTGRTGAALAASLVALFAPSWEGMFTLVDFWKGGLSASAIFEQVRGMNIDAITNWRFHGLRIDGLVRSMWWTPQHASAFTLGLLALITVARAGPSPTRRAYAGVGLFLALSVTMSPFLGGAFCLIHALVVLSLVATRRTSARALIDQALTVGPVLLAVGWTMLNGMDDGAGTAVSIGWKGLGRHAPVTTMVLSLGGLLLPAALCVWPPALRRLGAAWVAIPGVLVGLTLGWFVSLPDEGWVGFRAGNVLQVTLPMLAAAGLAMLWDASRRTAVALTAILLVVGAPTTLIDTFNAQDIENRAMGPGFYWTIRISREQQAGFRWIRRATLPDAVVQADPIVRGRNNWSLIPSFAGRRMAAGQPISLLPTPEYQERGTAVHALLTEMALPEAHRQALALGINFLWVDSDDSPAVGDRLRARPDLFGLVFHRGPVMVFDVRPGAREGGVP